MTLFLKDKCFYFFYFLSVFWFGLTGSLFFWLPYRFRFSYISLWNRFIVALARIFIGVKVNVIGRENIPSTPCVIMCKHQSEWETFYLQTIFPHLCTILKKELLGIPFFGWALRQMEPIAIDRSSPKDALRKVQEIGLKRLKQNRSVLIFPEGTRVKPGERGRYARSGANLAIAGETIILPIAHNAGIYWQNKQRKQAGTITFIIGEPISTSEKSAKQLMNEVENWIEEQSTSLLTTANPS
ncbi:MAG: 1-acyl-sn-glycerol-3-phosphate acyltransferase [Cellvibrionales bacterium]|nr:1-acyl-sn-glycerol-3-phosphate acyltransferase [Cellvibrionales bacterium]